MMKEKTNIVLNHVLPQQITKGDTNQDIVRYAIKDCFLYKKTVVLKNVGVNIVGFLKRKK